MSSPRFVKAPCPSVLTHRTDVKAGRELRYYSVVKTFLWMLLLTSAVCADEAADRPAIARTIASLNESPQRDEIFTTDADGRTALNELWKGNGNSGSASSSGLPTVVISHEPWGEATLYFPGIRPRMVLSREIRFVSPDGRWWTAFSLKEMAMARCRRRRCCW